MSDDDTETVYVGSHNTRNPPRYHTDPTCFTLRDTVVEKPRNVLERGAYTQCQVCKGDHASGGKDTDSFRPLRDRLESGEIDV